jgi:peptide/nickel transport system permease protein
MARFWLIKALRTLATMIFVVTFAFIVLRTSGDPVQSLLGPDATVEELAQFREQWGMDRPLPEQYLLYVGNVLRGEFGKSYRDGRPVLTIIAERVPWTLLLTLVAVAFAILFGVPAGILAALRRNTAIDRLIMSIAVFGFALPNFFLGILLILLFSLTLRWLPSSGTGSVLHIIMPALTLGLYSAGQVARFTRSSMLEVLDRPYMRAAMAKGTSLSYRIWRHALPNAAIPVVTILGINIVNLLAGAIIVEFVFAWPGVGRLMIASVISRDLAVVQGSVLLLSLSVIVINLLIDLLYGVLDPRIRVAH